MPCSNISALTAAVESTAVPDPAGKAIHSNVTNDIPRKSPGSFFQVNHRKDGLWSSLCTGSGSWFGTSIVMAGSCNDGEDETARDCSS